MKCFFSFKECTCIDFSNEINILSFFYQVSKKSRGCTIEAIGANHSFCPKPVAVRKHNWKIPESKITHECFSGDPFRHGENNGDFLHDFVIRRERIKSVVKQISWTSGHRTGSTIDSSTVAARSKVIQRSSTICPRKSTDFREKVRIISRSGDIRG